MRDEGDERWPGNRGGQIITTKPIISQGSLYTGKKYLYVRVLDHATCTQRAVFFFHHVDQWLVLEPEPVWGAF